MRRLEEMIAGFRNKVLSTYEWLDVSTFSDEAERRIKEYCEWLLSKAPDDVWRKIAADTLGGALWSSIVCYPGGLGEFDLGDWVDEVKASIKQRGQCWSVITPNDEIQFVWV